MIMGKGTLKGNKVLVIAYYYPPAESTGTVRTEKFVKYLAEFGWNPLVLTVKADQDTGNSNLSDERIIRTGAFLPANIFRRLIRRKSSSDYMENETGKVAYEKGSIISKPLGRIKELFSTFCFIPDEYVGWLVPAVAKGIRLVEKENINVIFATAPPNTDLLIGKWISILTGIPLVCDFRDTWEIYEKVYNPYLMRWKMGINRRMEKKVIDRTTVSVVVSEVMKQQMVKRFPGIAQAVEVIENGFDEDDFSDSIEVSDMTKFILIHFGNLYDWRSPVTLFKAIRLLEKDYPELYNKIEVRFPGMVPEVYKHRVTEFGLSEKMSFQTRMPYKESLDELKKAHCGIIIRGDLDNIENMLTAKIFDYLGTRLPVISVSGAGQLKDFVESEKIGINCFPEKPENIAAAIIRMYNEYDQFKDKMNRMDMSRFTRRTKTLELASVLQKAINYSDHVESI